MIFLSSFIQLTKINYHPIACNNSLRDQFIFIIRNNGNTSLFRNTMDRAYLITISNGINYTCLKELQYLLSYHFFHLGIQSSLTISNWLASSSNLILCWHNVGLTHLRSSRVYPIAAQCFFRVFNNLSSSCSERLALIITGYIFFSSR